MLLLSKSRLCRFPCSEARRFPLPAQGRAAMLRNSMDSQADLIKPRLEKREKLLDAGIDPYGGRFDVSESVATARANPVPDREVRLAGRVLSRRDMGKSLFVDIKDFTGKIQLYIQKQSVGEEQFESFRHFIDLGDIIGISGKLFTTRAGE